MTTRMKAQLPKEKQASPKPEVKEPSPLDVLNQQIDTLQKFYDAFTDLEGHKTALAIKERGLREAVIASGIDKGLTHQNTHLSNISLLLNQAVMSKYNYERANPK